MAHDIATINGMPAIAYIGDSPWHRLGTRLPSVTDLDAALTAASINWTVSTRPLYLTDPTRAVPADGAIYAGPLTQSSARAVTRDTDGAILGIVTDRYQPIQHTEAFGAMRPALAAGVLTIEVAGALGQGETVWMLTRLAGVQDEIIRPDVPGDRLKPFILLSTSHDGSRAFRMTPTATRVVCRNTIQAAWSETDGKAMHYTIRHTDASTEAMRELDQQVEQAIAAFRQTADHARHMADTPITTEGLRAFVTALMPTPPDPREIAAKRIEEASTGFRLREQNRDTAKEKDLIDRWQRECARIAMERNKAIDLAIYGSGNAGKTAWDALNGITEYIDHTARTLASGKLAGTVSEHRAEQTARAAIWGEGALMKAQAWTLARQLVTVVAA